MEWCAGEGAREEGEGAEEAECDLEGGLAGLIPLPSVLGSVLLSRVI